MHRFWLKYHVLQNGLVFAPNSVRIPNKLPTGKLSSRCEPKCLELFYILQVKYVFSIHLHVV